MRYLFIFIHVSVNYCFAQTTFTWISGSNTFQTPGAYGTQLIASSTNQPGSRQNAASWTSDDTTLWLFGGQGLNNSNNEGCLNDLWKYHVQQNQWTWMSGTNSLGFVGNYQNLGSPSSTALPAARQNACSWKGNDGCFYLFGGQKSYNNNLNDFWKFNPNTLEWTWINGASTANSTGNYGSIGVSATTNFPSARYGALYWTDNSGNFWLFGGQTYNGSSIQRLSDLWKFDTQSQQWVWMHGSNQVDVLGIYGSQNSAASTNAPGARQASATWTDSQENLWIFGGYGYPESGSSGYLSDLWKYSIATNQWTWVGGTKVTGTSAQYGNLGEQNSANHPGARQMAVTYTKSDGSLWMYGGWGYISLNNFGRLNDLWKYNPSSGIWSWEAGQNITEPTANYGIQNITDITSNSGGRRMATSWQTNDEFWFFGGNAIDVNDSIGVTNDLWKINTTTNSTSINELDIESNIYPNPATNFFFLPKNSTTKPINIFDCKGIQIKSYEIENNGYVKLSNQIEKGVYFVQIEGKVSRLIIE